VLVADGRRAAQSWVDEYAAGTSWFRGAFLIGSVVTADPLDPIPSTSDVDVMVVVAAADAPPKLGKLVHDGVLLDVTFLPSAALADVDQVAASFFLAPAFSTGGESIIADSTGRLSELARGISPTFHRPDAVLRRCDDVLARIRRRTGAQRATIKLTPPWSEPVIGWLFPASLTAVVVAVAAGRAPTVRRRYLDARSVLARVDLDDRYDALLELLGCAAVDPRTVQRHLDRLAATFDLAAAMARTPFPFSSDVTPAARALGIDGSQHLVDQGAHREAVFWILATWGRCHAIVTVDGSPDLRHSVDEQFRAAVADLVGVRDLADLRTRTGRVLAAQPELRSVAETIIARTTTGAS
jgi:hypothetical protein